MSAVSDRWKRVWRAVQAQQAALPSHVVVQPEDVEPLVSPVTPFDAQNEYFQVVVNEMYLTNAREWAKTYDPMVLAVTEFAYSGEVQTVPFVVGPTLLGKGIAQPQGMLYSNTRVAGIHPFAGSRFASTVILYRIVRRDYVKDLLQVVERAASALNVAAALVPYLPIADVVLQGVESLISIDDTQPIVGSRNEFGVGANPLVPSYFALIDLPDVASDELRVRGSKLFDAVTGEPFRRADYVLCSIEQIPERDDEGMLPFFEPLWNRVVQDATSSNQDSWKSAKANMLALAQAILLSPDLSQPQKFALIEEYQTTMSKYRKVGQGILKLGPEQRAALDNVCESTVAILDLE